ncbi:aminodeoxychorismate lyase [Streptomyces sp. CB00455]|uniref:endolytic transglycosylase MltG n=1 Tax=Streptomyces sp. CB00455 TaxID=1703927 RepID=UPI00093C33B4|nr:endolytic transglycosylase MltG [Streptomyces sp. CB00455]OKK15175.1 aminodeoxychorismate lyase [Streptomyces sp. CB00455]
MTEYGRGGGSEPWHPEDPLYGDLAWTAHQTQQGHAPYGGAPQQDYPQEPQYQQQYPQHQEYVPQQHAQQQHAQQQHAHPQQPHAEHLYPQQPHPQQPHPEQPHPQQQQYPQQQGAYAPQQPVYDSQGWDTGQSQYVAAAAQSDAYAGVDPYAQQPVSGYPGETPDLYTTPDAYPPPQPPGRRHLEPEPAEQAEEEPETGLLTGGGDDEGDGPADGGRRSGRKGGKGGKPKQRSGTACLLAAVVIIGVVGGGGYYGYTYIKDRFATAADYAGEGTGESVDVEIPKGASLATMGNILKKQGIVASVEAFTTAAHVNPKGKSIQPGVYPLKKKMSAAAAVTLMTDPTKLNVITVPEGKRNSEVYKAIDTRLGKPEGTTEAIAKSQGKNLGLPAWAGNNPKIMDPLEGFLYPARYDLSKDTTPESLLKQMIKQATDKYTELGIEAKAKDLGLENPLQVVTVASLVNAEGKNHDDFRKMSEVVYNRLKKTNDVTNQKLEFDSTYNYLKGTSNINFSMKEARALDHPYNTHFVKGLPPGPIGNPGADALSATLNPDHGGWMFFVSVDGTTTTFTQTYDEHQKLVAEFLERQKQKNGG